MEEAMRQSDYAEMERLFSLTTRWIWGLVDSTLRAFSPVLVLSAAGSQMSMSNT